MTMERKKAIIAGAEPALLRGLAAVFAREGYDLAAICGQEEECAGLEELLQEQGGRFFGAVADLPDAGVPQEAIPRLAGELGGLDVLVCAAARPVRGNFLDLGRDEMDAVFYRNYRSYLLCAKAAASLMKESGTRGSVVFVTSFCGLRANRDDCLAGAFHAALHRASESLAMQLAPFGIRLNCVAQGLQEGGGEFHKGIPLGHRGSPEEFAEAVLFLASERGAYITGTTLKADGGITLPGIPESDDGYGWNPERDLHRETTRVITWWD
jgi:glucose 1-dehydrogenase